MVDDIGMELSDDRRAMVYSAAGIYAGATLLGLVQALIPGGEKVSVLPDIAALTAAAMIVIFGRRIPRSAMAGVGLLGAALIGVALATTAGYGDAAVLYMWPALWMAYFFGTRGTVLVVLWIGLVHAVVVLMLPSGQASIDRWIDVEGAVVVVAVVVRALAARNERLMTRLLAEARIDPLTGLLNRRGLDERLEIEIARAHRDGSWLGVVSFDLDHFKWINDEHGHEVGDRVLVWLGSILATQIRTGDSAARIGGEEFVVVLPRADVHGAEAVAERVRRAVATRGAGSRRAGFGVGDDLALTVSAGVTAELAPVDAHQLLERADRAMYGAKRAGRDRVSIAHPGPSGDTGGEHDRAGSRALAGGRAR